MTSRPLSHLSTAQLLRLARRRSTTLGCGCGSACGRAHLGAEEGWIDWAASQLDAYVQRSEQLLLDAASKPVRYVYGGLMSTAQEIRDVGLESARRGASTVGEISTELSTRVAAAAQKLLTSLGTGLGAGWEELLGFKLGTGAVLFGVGALVLAGGGAWLLLTPGGQQLLVGGGRLAGGAGTALARAL